MVIILLFLQAIKEALRLNPPTGGTARLASYDVEVNGYMVPKGSMVAVSIKVQA